MLDFGMRLKRRRSPSPAAESRFRKAFHEIYSRTNTSGQTHAPGPTEINREMVQLGSDRQINNKLNGAETSLRRQLLRDYGFRKNDETGRWEK